MLLTDKPETMTKLYAFLLLPVFFFTACKTASKSYDKGAYDDAVELGVKKLQKNPSDAETKNIVKSAYALAVTVHEEAVRNLSASANDNRYESILKEYEKLQELYTAIQQSPAALSVVSPRNYGEYVQTYRDKAADVHLATAERWMSEGTKIAARNGYYEFVRALRFRDNTAIRAKRDEAYDLAITKIMVVPIQNYRGYNYNSNYQLQQFQKDVMRTLAYNMNDNFVKFYSECDMQGNRLEPDQILEMNLGRIRIGQPLDQNSRREVSKQVVMKETVYKKDSVVKEYGTVKATVTSTKRLLVSQGDLYLTLRDPVGRILWTDRFTGEHRWQTEFATYTGDERALSDNDKALLNKNKNYNPPHEDEIMASLYQQIQNDLSNRLRNYFSRL